MRTITICERLRLTLLPLLSVFSPGPAVKLKLWLTVQVIRPCVEAGSELVNPLRRLTEKNIAVDYIGQILATFSHPPSTIPQTSSDLLTYREQDILGLVAQRLRDKEIAEKLFISSHTVNAHLKYIFNKLDVNSR